MCTPSYDPLYLDGIRHFNQHDFFEAHESWEELWTEYQGPLRRFYQGLIQVAVCLHHFGNGNMHGTRKLYTSSVGYLEHYLPHCEGIDLVTFVASFQSCCQAVLEQEAPLERVDLPVHLIPRIELQSP